MMPRYKKRNSCIFHSFSLIILILPICHIVFKESEKLKEDPEEGSTYGAGS